MPMGQNLSSYFLHLSTKKERDVEDGELILYQYKLQHPVHWAGSNSRVPKLLNHWAKFIVLNLLELESLKKEVWFPSRNPKNQKDWSLSEENWSTVADKICKNRITSLSEEIGMIKYA